MRMFSPAAAKFCVLLALLATWAMPTTVRAQWDTETDANAPNAEQLQAGVEPYRSPEGAALRSVAWPGWGQFSLGESDRGTVYTMGALVGLVFAFELVQLSDSGNTKDLLRNIGWALYGTSLSLSAVAAFRTADALNIENGYGLDSEWSLAPPDRGVRIALYRREF